MVTLLRHSQEETGSQRLGVAYRYGARVRLYCKIIHPTEVCGFNDAEILDLAGWVTHGNPVSMWANVSALVESRPLCGRRGPHRRH